MSSPKITRMFGFFALAACACALLPAKKLETASAPSASFRTPAPKSMCVLFSSTNSYLPRGETNISFGRFKTVAEVERTVRCDRDSRTMLLCPREVGRLQKLRSLQHSRALRSRCDRCADVACAVYYMQPGQFALAADGVAGHVPGDGCLPEVRLVGNVARSGRMVCPAATDLATPPAPRLLPD